MTELVEREFAFGVVRQLFEGVVTDPATRKRVLSGAAAPAAADEGDVSFAALHGLFWVALNLAAEGPLMLAPSRARTPRAAATGAAPRSSCSSPRAATPTRWRRTRSTSATTPTCGLPTAAYARSLAARALDRLGRSDEALALAEAELADARRWGAAGTLGPSLRALGLLQRSDGLALLEESAAVLERSQARLELAKSLADLGAALRRERRPSDAREPLRRALELADACSADALVERVRSELYATGARPRTTALGGVDALTASERRVAAFAADGQSNRDIAQALFVTPKTVEVHLSNAYRKLGIRSRRELAGALASG